MTNVTWAVIGTIFGTLLTLLWVWMGALPIEPNVPTAREVGMRYSGLVCLKGRVIVQAYDPKRDSVQIAEFAPNGVQKYCRESR